MKRKCPKCGARLYEGGRGVYCGCCGWEDLDGRGHACAGCGRWLKGEEERCRKCKRKRVERRE